MNFRYKKRIAATIFISLALGLAQETSSFAVSTVLPSVSVHAGVAPVIGKPKGTAPTKLVIKDIIVGKGKKALTTSALTAQYVLMDWKTGKVLQSSWSSSGGFPFTLSGVIAGWQQGIPGMKAGGRRLLVIPQALAYPNGGGPAGTLVFVVDLLSVK